MAFPSRLYVVTLAVAGKAPAFVPALARGLARAGRPAVVLSLAVAAGFMAAWSARQHIQGHVERLEADAKVPMVSRVVAAHDLPVGTRLGVEHLAARDFPHSLVPSDSIESAQHTRLLGKVLRSSLRAGDLVLPVHARVVDQSAFSSYLGEGRRAITMPVDALNSVSGLLQPGDLIDLYVSFEYQRRRVTAPLLQGVLVLATGAQTRLATTGGGASSNGYTTVTLDTAPEDAVKLVAARQTGTITAVLRHPNDDQPSRKAARGDLASLLGMAAAPPPASRRAPVLYGNQNTRRVPRLAQDATSTRTPTGVFDLPEVQHLVSAWLTEGGNRGRHGGMPQLSLASDEKAAGAPTVRQSLPPDAMELSETSLEGAHPSYVEE